MPRVIIIVVIGQAGRRRIRSALHIKRGFNSTAPLPELQNECLLGRKLRDLENEICYFDHLLRKHGDKILLFQANEAKEHVDLQHPNMPKVVEVDTIEKKQTGPNSESLI